MWDVKKMKNTWSVVGVAGGIRMTSTNILTVVNVPLWAIKSGLNQRSISKN